MLPTTSFKPGPGQKKAEGSLHLICLPVTGYLILDFFETKKPFLVEEEIDALLLPPSQNMSREIESWPKL